MKKTIEISLIILGVFAVIILFSIGESLVRSYYYNSNHKKVVSILTNSGYQEAVKDVVYEKVTTDMREEDYYSSSAKVKKTEFYYFDFKELKMDKTNMNKNNNDETSSNLTYKYLDNTGYAYYDHSNLDKLYFIKVYYDFNNNEVKCEKVTNTFGVHDDYCATLENDLKNFKEYATSLISKDSANFQRLKK